MASSSSPERPPEHFDVLILGGGIAGLSAAHYLATNKSSSGLSVALIEAQDRFGGRLHTADFGVGHVELGANWVHGASPANCLFNLANTFGLIETPLRLFDRSQGAFLHSSGVAIDQEVARELYDELKTLEYSTLELSPQSERRTLAQFIDDEVERVLKPVYPPKEHSLIDAAVHYAKRYIELHGGDSLERQAAWGLGAYTEIDDDVTVVGGYRALVERMIEEIRKETCSGSKVVLRSGQEVSTVHWSSSSSNTRTSSPSSSSQLIKVKTKGGQRNYTARLVLVTFSLGVLKECHQSLFHPPLPLAKVQLIRRIGFGRLTKLYLAYRRPFWAPGTLNCLKLYTDPEEVERIKESNGSPDESDDDEDALLGLVNGFEEIPTSGNVLLAWVTGDQAAVVERWPADRIARCCTALLRRFTGDLSLPEPDEVLVSGWNGNPFIRGSYSYPSMETAGREDFGRLGEPVMEGGQGRLFFAGEATHPYYYSAAHGARASGLKAAQAISKQLTAGSP